MNPRTTLTLSNGHQIDLLAPRAADFGNLEWAAEHLAKENRYNGATPGLCYSVAQHSVECARRARRMGDHTIAAYVSLHDVHEALLKDDTTPKKRAFAALAEENFGLLASNVISVFDQLTDRHDAAIHEAAGLEWPPSSLAQRTIKTIDRVMLVTEWRDLMGGCTLPNAEAYADVFPLDRKIVPHGHWSAACRDLIDIWRLVLPSLRGSSHDPHR